MRNIHLSKTAMLAAAGMLGFCLIALTFQTTTVQSIDEWITGIIHAHRSAGMTILMKWYTFIGSGEMIALFSAAFFFLLLYYGKHRSEAFLFVLTVSSSSLLNILLKLYFTRERPFDAIIEETGYSFPSGHSMNAFTFYSIAAYVLWRRIPSRTGRTLLVAACSAMIILIGGSRVYLGVHYPSDIAGAYFISGVWVALMIQLYLYFRKRHASKSAGRGEVSRGSSRF